ncbi:MAG: hypothetical protein NZM42_08475, partial [Gemmatales bacterium]|nr:hypothetical protein [Gemmatales bacterium]
ELVRYDPHLIVGILGGSAGTTYDAFKLLAEAKKHGARVALFGRKINYAENQLAFIRFLRLIADDEISPEEAVRAYHGVLQRLGIRPHRPLDQDLQLTTNIMSYADNGRTISLPPASATKSFQSPASATSSNPCPCGATHGPCRCREANSVKARRIHNLADALEPEPDFRRMTPAEKVAYNLAKWRRILG